MYCLSISSQHVRFYSFDVSNDSLLYMVKNMFEKKYVISKASAKNITFKVIQVRGFKAFLKKIKVNASNS